MRHFLPIKGPGGRNLTIKEKVALVVLSLTLILSVLTLLAGNDAFGSDPARNPVFGLVGAFARPIGVGILALYGVVLLWSSLIFFKGERSVRMAPLPGRALAAFGAAIGISGLLGIAQLDAAGELGQVVGSAIGHTFGAFGFLILLAMMALGSHLAGQGAWSILRGSAGGLAGGAATAGAPVSVGGGGGGAGGFALPTTSPRIGGMPTLPVDGDPSADERTMAITQAMDEIERQQGVRIVEVEEPAEVVVEEPEEARTTIGEAVESLPEPEVETEEAQVQRCLDAVASALHGLKTPEPEIVAEQIEEAPVEEAQVVEEQEEEPEELAEIEDTPAATLDGPAQGYVSLLEEPAEAQEEEEDEEEEIEEEEPQLLESEEEEEELEEEDEDELEEEEEEEDLEDDDDDEDEEWEEVEEEEEEDEEEDDEDDDDSPPQLVQPYLFPVAKREVEEEEEDDEDESPTSQSDPRESTFDWRGKPVE